MLELKRARGEAKPEERPDKKTRLLAALDRGMTMVHLDARRPGVSVPEHLRQEPHLLLNLSYRFTPPDLTVSEWGVRQTLTFGGVPYAVAVPWNALYAISSHATKEFYMYPEDMPPELLAAQAQRAEDGEPAPDRSPSLKEVARGPADEGPAAESSKQPPKRGHLRLVK